jgi:hypothetical protein
MHAFFPTQLCENLASAIFWIELLENVSPWAWVRMDWELFNLPAQFFRKKETQKKTSP